MSKLLVIGYGNELRGDDGLGPAVARSIESMQLPNVDVLVVHQLTPDLAETVANVDRVLFIDACIIPQREPIVIQRVETDGRASTATHACSPELIVGLSQILFGKSISAWLMKVGGECFDPGSELSATALRQVADATQQAAQWLTSIHGERAHPCGR